MAENEVVETTSAKLNTYMEKNKKIFLCALIVFIVALVGFIVGAKVINSSRDKALIEIDELTFTLTDDSASLEEGELNARRIDAIDNLAAYVNKGGIVGARANMLCADLTYQQGNYAESAEYWKKAAEKSPKSYIAPLAYFNMGACYEQLNNLDDAAANYKKAGDSDSFAMAAHAKFSYARIIEGQGKYAEAVAAYDDVTAKNPDSSWAKLAKTRIISLKAEGKAE